MASGSRIEERDGETVVVTPVASEATARELKAAIDSDAMRRERGWWGQVQGGLDTCLRVTSEILATMERSYLALLAVGFGAIAAVLAARAWPAMIPIDGLGWLMSIIGVMLVIAIGIGGHGLWRAGMKGEWVEFGGLLLALVFGILLNGLASLSLQSQAAEEQATGYQDAQSKITELESERGKLMIQTYTPPPAGKAAQLQAQVDALRAQAAVNRLGDQLVQTVGALVGDCTGAPDFYSGKYCPEILRLTGEQAAAATAEADYAAAARRLAQIDGDPQASDPIARAGELASLRALRPKPQGTITLLRWAVKDWAEIVPFLPGAVVTLFVELMMLLWSVLAGRRVYVRRGG